MCQPTRPFLSELPFITIFGPRFFFLKLGLKIKIISSLFLLLFMGSLLLFIGPITLLALFVILPYYFN